MSNYLNNLNLNQLQKSSILCRGVRKPENLFILFISAARADRYFGLWCTELVTLAGKHHFTGRVHNIVYPIIFTFRVVNCIIAEVNAINIEANARKKIKIFITVDLP